VGWAVTQGGGSIAPNNASTDVCGATFGTTASTTTDLAGKASVCWTLGAKPGINTVVATPTAGGDAPVGVVFAPATVTFTATGTLITPTAGATGGTFPYDGLAHAGSGTCSNSLVPSLSYSGGSAPVNAGSYTLTVTCGGGALYNTVTSTAPIVIGKLSAAATGSSASILLGAAVPSFGCAVTGLLAAEAGSVTCTASAPASPTIGSNAVTPVVSPASPTNYQVQLVNGTLSVTYRQDACFTPPLTAALPPTSNFQLKGSTIQVRCLMKDAQSNSVGAVGNLLVEDLGSTGASTPTTALAVTNAFAFVSPANVYSLSTSGASFIAGHFYKVSASWDDGSTSTGYFYISP
jgi:hypothetical protein